MRKGKQLYECWATELVDECVAWEALAPVVQRAWERLATLLEDEVSEDNW